jgi:bacterioferritin
MNLMIAIHRRENKMNHHTTPNIISMLQIAYRMELETVVNYLANSVHLDGVLAEEIKRALAADVPEELGHAHKIAHRIKQLEGRIPGSLELQFDQESLQPPQDTVDIDRIVRGVVEAETAAIEHYRMIIEQTRDTDPVTADLSTQLMADEEEHRTLFAGFLRESQVEL